MRPTTVVGVVTPVAPPPMEYCEHLRSRLPAMT